MTRDFVYRPAVPVTDEERRQRAFVKAGRCRHPKAAAAYDQYSWLQFKIVQGCSPATIGNYRWITDKLLVQWPDVAYEHVTDAHILPVLAEATKKSRAGWAAAFKSWFKWGVKTRRIELNPCDFLPDIKPAEKPYTPIFTIAEEAALRALPYPDGTLMQLLFETGLRKSEATHLTAKRIDFIDEQLIVIEGVKGGGQRVTPIDNESAPLLLSRLAALVTLEGLHPDDHLWFSRPGGGNVIRRDKPCHPATFHFWWCRCIEAAGIMYRRPHTTRHTFARRWHKRGLTLDDIQWLLGHADLRTTQVYTPTEAVDVRERMAEARRNPRG